MHALCRIRPGRLISAGLLALLTGCGPSISELSPSYWAGYESRLKAEGKLRTDRAPADVPFTNADLVRNFAKTAFGLDPEFQRGLTPAERARTEVVIKWTGPIRYAVYGQATEADWRQLSELTGRLGRASGLQIEPVTRPEQGGWNLGIYFFNFEERTRLLADLAAEGEDALLSVFANLFSDELICSGTMLRKTNPDGVRTGEIDFAFVFIRPELPRDLRLSCIEEEISQGMGLIRDDDAVRPSLFNEDEEFAFLTLHDEYLLRILYDSRLKPGTRREEAMPIVRAIAGELELPSDF